MAVGIIYFDAVSREATPRKTSVVDGLEKFAFVPVMKVVY